MTPQQPQQEERLLFEQCDLECIAGLISPGKHFSEWMELLKQIRSRPFPAAPETMTLPEEMPFSPEEIQMKKFVITEGQRRSFFDAWMRSDKDVRELHQIQNVLSGRIICVGNEYGGICASCHKHKTSGYFICEECFYGQTSEAAAKAREDVLNKIENYVGNNAPWMSGTDDRITDARKLVAFIRSLRTTTTPSTKDNLQ